MTIGRVARASGLLMAGLLWIAPAPAYAQLVHSVQFGVGLFSPRGFDSRHDRDVLVADLLPTGFFTDDDSLEFDGCKSEGKPIGDCIKKFRSAEIGGEWNVAINRRLEVGIGVGYTSRSVPSRYTLLVNSEQNFADIQQSIRLRTVPITGLVRVLPFGNPGSFQPYFGAGIAAVNFRYSEIGDFVDPDAPPDENVFSGVFRQTGTGVGPVWLIGARIPIQGDVYGFNVEWRYRYVTGKLDENDFLTDRIDLGGGTAGFTFMIRF
jgi:hypothetical protein